MVLYIILGLNLLLVLNFIFKNIKNKSKLFFSLFFLFLPLIGYIIYLVSMAVIKFYNSKLYDRLSLVNRYKSDEEIHSPDVEKELDIIPINDAMVMSNANEKRKLLIDQLKKDIHVNYKNILDASDDEDSETAHYVASVKMEVYNKLNLALQKALKAYEHSKRVKDRSLSSTYSLLSALIDVIESKLLSENELSLYIMRYCEIVEEEKLIASKEINLEQVKFLDKFIMYSVSIKRYINVIETFNKIPKKYRNERMYIQILKMYYETNQEDNFNKIFNDLRSSSIPLSSEGLELVRFWLLKQEKAQLKYAIQ